MKLFWRMELPPHILIYSQLALLRSQQEAGPCWQECRGAVGAHRNLRQCRCSLEPWQCDVGAEAATALSPNQGFAVGTITRHLGNCEGIFFFILTLVGNDQHRVVKIHTIRESEM